MTRSEIIEIFGEPDATGGTSRKYKTPMLYLYGQVEFAFGPLKSDGLVYVMDRGKDGMEHNFLLSSKNA